MIEEAFCLAGLLKAGTALERVASLLPPGRRDRVLQLSRELSVLPHHELQKRLVALREPAVLHAKARLTKELGTGWRELPPLLQCWLGEVVLRTHGYQNHQK